MTAPPEPLDVVKLPTDAMIRAGADKALHYAISSDCRDWSRYIRDLFLTMMAHAPDSEAVQPIEGLEEEISNSIGWLNVAERSSEAQSKSRAIANAKTVLRAAYLRLQQAKETGHG